VLACSVVGVIEKRFPKGRDERIPDVRQAFGSFPQNGTSVLIVLEN